MGNWFEKEEEVPTQSTLINADNEDGVLSQTDITDLLYSNEGIDMVNLENKLGSNLTEKHNIRLGNVFVNLCREYDVDLHTLPLKRQEIEELGYIRSGKQTLMQVLEYFFTNYSVVRMHTLPHNTFGMFHRLTNRSNGYYFRS